MPRACRVLVMALCCMHGDNTEGFLGFCRRLQKFFFLVPSFLFLRLLLYTSVPPPFLFTTAATSPSVFKLASKSRSFFLYFPPYTESMWLVRSICAAPTPLSESIYSITVSAAVAGPRGYESRNVVFIEPSGSVISRVTRNSYIHYRYYIFQYQKKKKKKKHPRGPDFHNIIIFYSLQFFPHWSK